MPEGNAVSTTPLAFTIVLDNPAKLGDTVRVNTSGATPGTRLRRVVDVTVPLVTGQLTTPVDRHRQW